MPEPDASRTPFLGAFESTFLPDHGVDVAEIGRHDVDWRSDVDQVLAAGPRRLRYPLRWHRIERSPGTFDWSVSDAVLGYLHERGVDPVVDLVHHTSYPAWLSDGFRDHRFGPAFLRFAEAVAHRYPWLQSYTLFNEPFATLFLAGHEALCPPYYRGIDGFARLVRNVLPAVSQASRCYAELLPDAKHVWVDTCEHHAGTPGGPAAYAELANDRRHVLLDLALKHDLDDARPFLGSLLRAGVDPVLEMDPIRVDVVGLDYYCHSEWWYDEGTSQAPSPHPVGFAAIAEQYARRYGLPLLLSETNIRGLPSDRASWLRFMLEQYELAVSRGVPLQGFCWFPSLDSCDWDSLLARPAGRVDPVGVVSLGAGGERVRTTFTDVWEAAAAGTRAGDLPAYRFQPPCDLQLAGFAPLMSDWPWVDPPAHELVPPVAVGRSPRWRAEPTRPEPSGDPLTGETPTGEEETAMHAAPTSQPDLVVLSHLRWTWVWQRPQHLVSRFASMRTPAGARTFFVEEPMAEDVSAPVVRSADRDGITRVWLAVPRYDGQPEVLGFDARGAETYGELLAAYLTGEGRPAEPDVLAYTPMALDVAQELRYGRLLYDVMDDLASFKNAPEGLRLRQRRLLAEADVVFAGGRSLHRSVQQQRRGKVHLFPSGVETSHYEKSRSLREPRERKVAGYVGVLDERLDLELVLGLAEALPEWTIRIVGPIAKIDASDLPQAPNLEYPGMAAYTELPSVMAGFDVALMPFALNEATRSISPTKTLEYLAAGLPVVSTRVPDVVADYSGVVHLADTAQQFAEACEAVLLHSCAERDKRLQPIQRRHEWDVIASSMADLIAGAAAEDEVLELRAAAGVTA